MKTKAGKDVIQLIAQAYKANLPVLLEGPHGVGKSQLIEQAAKQLDIEFIVRDLSLMEPPDLIGLPVQSGGRTVYAPPAFLPTKGRGIIAFEELNRSERYMMSPCLQLLTARCLNDYKLPEGWLPVAAINPASEGYDVRPLDPALQSRFVRVQVAADVKNWLEWAEKSGVHSGVRQYVEAVPEIFDTTNPRSWACVSDLITANGGDGAGSRQILLAGIAGLVGETHAKAFLKQLQGAGDATISVDAVLRKYRGVRSTVVGWAKARRTDQLQSIAHQVQVALQASGLCEEIRGSQAMTRNVENFIKDLPADMGQKVRKAAKNGGALP